jgi:uncharacterized protein (TIGR00288 family)
MALFCDFENVALGVRDASYSAFSIQKVLERLLLKGNIVVKKAYCDWDRYKEFKGTMHEAAFELIEIPHVRMSGKNSADIRMVVDALDLCYTKSHVDTFVIISGDSDFSPLVSKLRENNKTVIGVGVKNSTSDLLTANCDEFIYYDDLVRDEKRPRRAKKKTPTKGARTEEGQRRGAAPPGRPGPDRRHARGPGGRARGRGKGLGLDGQADDQAAQARLQRELPWLSQLLCAPCCDAARSSVGVGRRAPPPPRQGRWSISFIRRRAALLPGGLAGLNHARIIGSAD